MDQNLVEAQQALHRAVASINKACAIYVEAIVLNPGAEDNVESLFDALNLARSYLDQIVLGDMYE